MENHYLINVAGKRNPEDEYGVHLFVAKVRDKEQAKLVYKELCARFHPNEFNIDVTEWRGSGRSVTGNHEEWPL